MSLGSSIPPNSDRNLLFGILALQMDFIDRDALVGAMHAWVLDKAKPLGQVLQEQAVLSAERRTLLEALVQEHLKQHDDDPEKSLAVISSIKSLRRDLESIADPDLHASLAVMATMPAATPESTIDDVKQAGLRYRILRPHARGGLGEVYVAEDQELHREVALKEIQQEHAHNLQSRGRFLLEAEITGGLEHPGIVPVYGLGQYADGRPFYAMRFIKGDNLKEAIRRFHVRETQEGDPGERSLALRQLLRRFIDVCNAVAYAHSRGVLHRDVKPGNIMLGKYGETLVVDWGLAKPVDRQEMAQATDERTLRPTSESAIGTHLGSVIGTPAYMSPEQAAGRLDELGPASDIYSLGATLYVVLTGEPPFRETEAGAALQKVQRGEWLPPRQVRPQTPLALDAICGKAMALKPQDRYPTAMALATDLEHWLADEPVSAYRESLVVQLARWGRRHRPLVAGAAALLLTALAALAVGIVIVNREKNRTAEEQQRTQEALEAEAKARERTRQALDEMSSQVIENWLARQGNKLEPAQEEFLKKALASYQEFAAEAGDSEEVRAGVAKAHYRIGNIHYKLGEVKAAEEAFRRAIVFSEKLAADFPDKLKYRREQAGSQNNLGVLLAATGRPKEAETAYRGAMALRKQLVADLPKEPSCQQDLAISYNTLGNLLKNTGRPKEAEALLRDAVALQKQLIADSPTTPEYRRDLAVSYYNLVFFLSGKDRSKEAEAIIREAVGLRKQLVTEFPTKPEYRQDLARSYDRLGTLLKNTGRPKEAEAAYHEALALQQQLAADFPTKREYRQNVAAMHQNLAILLATTGRPQEAEAALRDALTVKKRLAADYPAMTEYRQDMATGYSNLGVLLYETGRLKESEAAYRDALAIKKQLAVEFPTMPEYRAAVALSQYNLGILLNQTKRPAEAEVAYRDSITLFKQLAADLPTNPEHRKDLAKSYSGLGSLLTTTKRSQEAETAYREALALHKQLAADFPTMPDHRQNVGGTSNNLGVFLKGIGRAPEAETAYREALALRKQLAADFPTMHHYQFELAATMVNLAEIWRDRKEFAQARELLEQAQSHLQTALKANPRHPYYREVFRTHHVALATALAGLGEHTQAAATAEQLAGLGWDAANDTYSAACALALCVPVVEKDVKLPEAQRKIHAQSYAGTAIELLCQAVAKGYKDAAHMEKDTDLDALREREDFKKLLAELEKSAMAVK